MCVDMCDHTLEASGTQPRLVSNLLHQAVLLMNNHIYCGVIYEQQWDQLGRA